MSFTVSELKTELTAELHGTTLSKVSAPDNLIQRAGRQLLLDIDPRSMIRHTTIANGVYDSIYDYATPADLKGDGIIAMRPQVNVGLADNFSQRYIEEFGYKKEGNTFVVEPRSGTNVLRLSKSVGSSITIDSTNSLTDNGTWSAGGDAGNLTADGDNYVTGSGSLNFDLDGSGTTGYLEKTLTTAVDLSDHEDISSIFRWVYVPDSSIFTSVDFRWGSSSAYWNKTVTAPHFGSVVTGWNLFRFDWNGATETGSPDSSAIDYERVTITYDGTADTDWRIDKAVSRIGEIYEILYYSNYLFQDSSTNAWQEKIASDNDLINIDYEGFNLLLYKCITMAASQISGEDAGFDYAIFEKLYQEGISEYQNKYKSQRNKPQSTYYRFR